MNSVTIRIIDITSFWSVAGFMARKYVSLRVEIMERLTRHTELLWDGGWMNDDALRRRVGIDTRH